MTTTFEEAELCFPQLNSSCRKIMRPHSVSMLIYITLSSISVITVVLNLLVIISISHFKKLHTPTNLLLLSLALSDFFVGLLMVFQIILIDGCWFLGDLMCAVYFVLDYAVTAVSIGTMVLISIDRYVAICYPLLYPIKITQYRVKICVSVFWMVCFFCNGLYLKVNVEQPGRYSTCIGECVAVIESFLGLLDVLLSLFVSVTIIVILHMRIFAVVVSQARAMRSNIRDAKRQGSVRITVKKSEVKAARALGVVVVVFLICVCPYFCVTLSGDDAVVSASSAAFVMCLFYINSCLNPLIYAFFYPWFRNCIRVIVTLQILKPGSCDANILCRSKK
ncbi:trace amine-associated receptor 13c-like [Salarias fasciatus]|uniref:trace amine-associated receptor 13c-like n=1 Tax=Salarias fasciatus TaxID=181472 RepID=UPI001176C353|nr:trace amine-associated receptor 13c-like [Salarias fasciatus]